jgi:hypothetical protein
MSIRFLKVVISKTQFYKTPFLKSHSQICWSNGVLLVRFLVKESIFSIIFFVGEGTFCIAMRFIQNKSKVKGHPLLMLKLTSLFLGKNDNKNLPLVIENLREIKKNERERGSSIVSRKKKKSILILSSSI